MFSAARVLCNQVGVHKTGCGPSLPQCTVLQYRCTYTSQSAIEDKSMPRRLQNIVSICLSVPNADTATSQAVEQTLTTPELVFSLLHISQIVGLEVFLLIQRVFD
jgi:hypothetical protein